MKNANLAKKTKFVGLLALASIAISACSLLPGGGEKVDMTPDTLYDITAIGLDGNPLAGVEFSIGEYSGVTDEDGVATFNAPNPKNNLPILTSGATSTYRILNDHTTSAGVTAYELDVETYVKDGTAPKKDENGQLVTYEFGDVVYDFSITDTEGDEYTLSEILMDYKACVINIWATWCGPCASEFPAMEAAYQKYSDDICILALDGDSSESMNQVKSYKKNKKLSFIMGRDTARLTTLFEVQYFPTTIMIDRYGTVCDIAIGADPSQDSWEKLFEDYSSDDYDMPLLGHDDREDY